MTSSEQSKHETREPTVFILQVLNTKGENNLLLVHTSIDDRDECTGVFILLILHIEDFLF